MEGSVVLYCGMADDIMQPLLLVPDVRIIYVISLFDHHCASKGTWESQMEDIKTVLITGRKQCYQYKKGDPTEEKIWDELDENCDIVKESLDDTKWVLRFCFIGIMRQLVYFHHRNFEIEWPKEIKGVGHLITSGSVDIEQVATPKYKTFRDMMRERCEKNFKVYAYQDTLHWYLNADFVENIHDGKDKDGSEIGIVNIDREKIDEIFNACNYTYDFTSSEESCNCEISEEFDENSEEETNEQETSEEN